METLKCARCKEHKPFDDFWAGKKYHHSKDTYCKPCRREYGKAYAIKHGRVPRKKIDPNATHKICYHCNSEKPISNFGRDNRKDGRRFSTCKQCKYEMGKSKNQQWIKDNKDSVNAGHRDWYQRNKQRMSLRRRKKLFGLSKEQFFGMVEQQAGRCWICGRVPESIQRFCVDHDHKTGKVRGLLCVHCNTGLGMFGDNIGTLKRAVLYLIKHGPAQAFSVEQLPLLELSQKS